MSIIGTLLVDASQLIERTNDFNRREIHVKPLFPNLLCMTKEEIAAHPKFGEFVEKNEIDVEEDDLWKSFAPVRAKVLQTEGPLRFGMSDGVVSFQARYDVEVEGARRQKEKKSVWNSVLQGATVRDAAEGFQKAMVDWLKYGLPNVFEHISKCVASVPSEQYVFEYANVFKIAASSREFDCASFGDHTKVDEIPSSERKRTLLMALSPSTQRQIPIQTVIMMVDAGADTQMVLSALKNKTLLTKTFVHSGEKRVVRSLRGYGLTGAYVLPRQNETQQSEDQEFVV
jgi:hypothetical protein